MKKGDFFIIALALVIAVFWLASSKSGDTVSIYVDGKLYKEVPLEKDAVIEVKSQYGKNTVVIENKEVRIIDADCPGKDCEKGKIKNTLNSLTCLPNRVTVVIEQTKTKNETDVVL